MPEYSIHLSNMPFGIPDKRLGSLEAGSLDDARAAAARQFPGRDIVVQLAATAIAAAPGTSGIMSPPKARARPWPSR